MARLRTMSFQLKPELRELLETQAAKDDRTLSWELNHYILKGLEADGITIKALKTPPRGRPRKKSNT